jgi:hypothetical protein
LARRLCNFLTRTIRRRWQRYEAVAHAADGDEVLGFGGFRLNITTEADDEVVDGAGVGALEAATLVTNHITS